MKMIATYFFAIFFFNTLASTSCADLIMRITGEADISTGFPGREGTDFDDGKIIRFSFDINLDATYDQFPSDPKRGSFPGAVTQTAMTVGDNAELYGNGGLVSTTDDAISPDRDLAFAIIGDPFGNVSSVNSPFVLSGITYEFTGPANSFTGDAVANLLEVSNNVGAGGEDSGLIALYFQGTNGTVFAPISSASASAIPEPSSGTALLGMVMLVITGLNRGKRRKQFCTAPN